MTQVQALGSSASVAAYKVADNELATGSTLGGPKVATVIKATGAIEKVYSTDLGETLFGTLVLHHWDERTKMNLTPTQVGSFVIHPEHQEHLLTLANDVEVHEDIFVLSGHPSDDGSVDPPAVYYTVTLTNQTNVDAQIGTYAFCQMRGDTAQDLQISYDEDSQTFFACNAGQPHVVRVFGCSQRPAGHEATADYGKAVSHEHPGMLSGNCDAPPRNPLAVYHLSHTLQPGESSSFSFVLSFSAEGRNDAAQTYANCPPAREALDRTVAYYHDILGRSVVLTPNPTINRGVLWSKANMLRIETLSPTGWCFTNDPSRSNNSVARDTCWFGFGADYLQPDFARESLMAYVRLQEKNGKIIEYYDIRNNHTEDYGLNINDNTALLILALWHHYTATGDTAFLHEVYPAAAKAARYLLSQRNEQGLVWCTATGTSDWGIIGWRNVITNYTLSGATTEVNSESYAALNVMTQMAKTLRKTADSKLFKSEAQALKIAINTHLYNRENGLYYLNIDLDGTPCSDVTSDLIFPVMFGVADDETAAHIISRLSAPDFWSEGGMHTTPTDSPTYTPTGGWGLLGGVWVGVAYWYAFSAAPYNPEFMDYALSTGFSHYSRNPRQNNTVPGQFSEWLHGQTLANQGMMLSPWFPPRYLWAAIEGAAGFSVEAGRVRLQPRLSNDWKWMAVQHMPFRGKQISWLVTRMPDLHVASTHRFDDAPATDLYTEDCTKYLHVTGDDCVLLGLRSENDLLLFLGNTAAHTTTAAISVDAEISLDKATCHIFDSFRGTWRADKLDVERLRIGATTQIERRGFCLYHFQKEQ